MEKLDQSVMLDLIDPYETILYKTSKQFVNMLLKVHEYQCGQELDSIGLKWNTKLCLLVTYSEEIRLERYVRRDT